MNAHKNGDAVPHGTSAFLLTSGHLAVWAALYTIGITLVFAEYLDQSIGLLGLVYVALCAHAGYLLDRVKFRNADLDPADLMSDPIRHQFLRRHIGTIRVLMLSEWVIAVIVGALISPVLAGLVVLGILAGFGYAGWKPGRVSRLKDFSGLKAFLVSGAVVGLAVMTAYAGDLSAIELNRVSICSTLGIGLIVLGDAIICDLDDRVSDAVHRTRSLPVLVGSHFSAIVASILLASGALLVVIAGDHTIKRAIFAALVVMSGVWILRMKKRRDWIDGRMFGVAIALISIW